jgi:hypothetical protein
MHYRDLVQFEPVESVIQLLTATDKDKAREHVRTYVISERMADQLTNLVIPHIQFLSPHDNRGVLVVGNYGTGKSHLMSLLAAVAEHADLVQDVTNPGVRQAMGAIAGRFKVLRTEIGSVTGSLRDMLLEEMRDALEEWGTPVSFPPADRVTNNKDLIIQAVAALQERYPEHGMLLVVDELLDYLLSRNEQQLILDLGFLRELGEVAAVTPFRFLGGLQETLFGNPKFAFVAGPLRRVQDRFEQVRIVREDVAYVVAHRLLAKTDEQVARIVEYLRPFARLYASLSERLGEFARLFPVHPAYLETFERVYLVEKREVLKTLSGAMRGLLDQEVPSDRPGLITYDQYWDVLRAPSMRSVAGVATVIDKSNVLESRVHHAYTRPHLKDMALRIVHALSVQRLTTDDINAPIGVTAQELRDDLCLYVQMPEATAEFLLDQVQVALREIQRTVSGQYISYEDSNGQYYLDLKKDIDFDAKIAERGELMSNDTLSRYYRDALRQSFTLSDTTYVVGSPIWFYELPWADHGVTREGYLFFGAPDERSTAQPPRDYYVYVVPPFIDREWHDEERADEVIFTVEGVDADFVDIVRTYAGARALSEESATHRTVYADKAEAHLRRLRQWFTEHLPSHLQVTYQGVTQPIREVLAELRSSASGNIEDLVRMVAAHKLEPLFAELYPEYPRFRGLREPISRDGRKVNAMEAVRALAGRSRTNLATAILDGLGLLDEANNVRPLQSPFARYFLDRLQAKGDGQVLNRDELMRRVAAEIEPIDRDVHFCLESEWVAVVLLAMVYHGDIELELQSRATLDAGSVERAASMTIDDLAAFRLVKSPRDIPVSLWAQIFEALGLSPGLVTDSGAREQGVRELQRVVGEEQERLARLEARLVQGVQLWNEAVFTDMTVQTQEGEVVGSEHPRVTLSNLDLLPYVREYKRFLQELQPINSVGKLRNLRIGATELHSALEAKAVTARAGALLDLVDQLQPLTSYLVEAQANLLDEHPWSGRAKAVRGDLLDDVRRHGRGESQRSAQALRQELETLKAAYVAAYAEEHRRLVLGPEADARRGRLYQDPRLHALDTLSRVTVLNEQELTAWKREIENLPTCRGFHEGILAETPTCRYCGLRPAQRANAGNADATLQSLDDRLDRMLANWRRALCDSLRTPHCRGSIAAMTPAERRPIEALLSQAETATEVPEGFVESANQALRGVQVVSLSVEELVARLRAGGLPCDEGELQARFAEFLRQALAGYDAQSTRINLDG